MCSHVPVGVAHQPLRRIRPGQSGQPEWPARFEAVYVDTHSDSWTGVRHALIMPCAIPGLTEGLRRTRSVVPGRRLRQDGFVRRTSLWMNAGCGLLAVGAGVAASELVTGL